MLWVRGPWAKVPAAVPYSLAVDTAETVQTGRVIDEETGAPVEGAEVRWQFNRGERSGTATTTTDADGRFRIRADGLSRIHVRRRGYAIVVLLETSEVPPVIRLRRGARVEGRVTSDLDGSPVAGLEVDLGRSEPVTTDADGRFALDDVEPGEHVLYARGKGWIPKGLEGRERGGHPSRHRSGYDPFLVVLEGGSTTTRDVVVERGVEARGRVLDEHGDPAVGVPVWVESDEDPAFGWSGWFLPPDAATDVNGGFRVLSLLPRATYAILTRVQGGATVKESKLQGSREAPIDVTLQLPASRWVEVSVVEEGSGEPIRGARVGAYSIAQGIRTDRRSWTTDEKGIAWVGPMGPERGGVDVTASGYVNRNQVTFGTASVERGGTKLTVALPRERTISGRVLLPDGTPAIGALVRISANGSKGLGDPLFHEETTDATGAFVVREMGAIPYSLDARLEKDGRHYLAKGDSAPGQGDVILTLAESTKDEGGAPSGLAAVREAVTGKKPAPEPEPEPTWKPATPKRFVRVLDASGKPVPRATLEGLDGFSVVDGTWEIPTLDDSVAWPIQVTFVRAETESRSPLPFGPATASIDARKADEVLVRLPPERAISGTLLGPDGRGLDVVLVTATPTREAEKDQYHGEAQTHGAARTRRDGTFRVGRLGDEDYALSFELPDGVYLDEKPARVAAGAAGLVVRTHAGVAVKLTVKDSRGRPVGGAKATSGVRTWVWERFGPERELVTEVEAAANSEGVVLLSPLDPRATYELAVEGPKSFNVGPRTTEGGPYLLPHTDPRWKPSGGPLTLGVLAALTGTVESEDGKPVASATVYFHDHPWAAQYPEPQSATTDASGRFEFRDATEGEHSVTASWNRGAQPDPAAPRAVVRTDDPKAVVRLARGATLGLRLEGGPDGGMPATEVSLWEDPESSRLLGCVGPGADGIYRFQGLTEGARYTIWVAPRKGFTAYVSGVVPSPSVIPLPLAPGRALRGKANASPGNVSALGPRSGMLVEGTMARDGTYEVEGLVDTIWSVGAGPWAVAGGTHPTFASGKGRPGTPLDLVPDDPSREGAAKPR